jgi:hypothetical protein
VDGVALVVVPVVSENRVTEHLARDRTKEVGRRHWLGHGELRRPATALKTKLHIQVTLNAGRGWARQLMIWP